MNEAGLFNFLKEKFLPSLERSEDKYGSFDCFCRQKNVYIELKCRNTHYEKLLIEKVKYQRLMEDAKDRGMIPIYINSTPDGIWAFNLKNLEIDWFQKGNLPATTEFENNEKVSKEVGHIFLQMGKRLA